MQKEETYEMTIREVTRRLQEVRLFPTFNKYLDLRNEMEVIK